MSLYILKKNGDWITVTNHVKYNMMYKKIREILLANESKGRDAQIPSPSIFDFGNIVISVKYCKSHRCCTILCCLQYDRETQGLRFLAYGTKHNEDCTYGIGMTLNCVSVYEILSKVQVEDSVNKFLD